MAKVGKPSTYTVELGRKICDAVATSTKRMKFICQDHGFPGEEAIYDWRLKYPEFGQMYAQAKAAQAELMAEKLVEEVENLVETCSIIDEKGMKKVDPGMVAATRLSIDTKKWIACKLAPRIYGERKAEQDQAEEHKLVIELKHD